MDGVYVVYEKGTDRPLWIFHPESKWRSALGWLYALAVIGGTIMFIMVANAMRGGTP